MPDIKKTGRDIENKVTSFLTGKPLWMWLATGVIATGILFGIFYVVSQMLNHWWMYLSLILIIGIVWGSVTYSAQKKSQAKKAAGTGAKKRAR